MKKPSTFKNIVRGILGKDEKRSRLEKEIVKLAQRRGGRLSILEIVAETSLNTKEADEIMEEMTVKGYVTMDVTDSGAIVYTFPGMAEKAQQEKQEWFKREVARDTTPSQPPRPEPPAPRRSPIQHNSSANPSPFPPPGPKPRRTAPPVSPPKPNVMPKMDVQGFTFALQECKRSGNNILCTFQVKSNKQNKKLAIRPGVRVLDASGKDYSARVQVISGDVEDAIEYLWVSLRAWIPLKLSVTISMGSWQATWQVKNLSLLEFSCKNDILGPEFTVPFRELPLS